MRPVEIKTKIYWVGGIDWDLRYFHGYLTPRGTTYNAYLIVDEKIVLVDTVKHHLFDEMLSRIKKVVDPARIDYLVVNHVEMDHSGSVPKIMDLAPGAKIVTSPQGKKGLERHYKRNWDFVVVNSGDELNIGSRTLKFVLTPMVHWPDSMVTYIPEEKLLLPNDAFGQHIASIERFDDELGWDVVHEEAAKYYANIVLPYGDQVNKALDVVSQLPIDVIAPSHGVIWRSFLPRILQVYRRWANHETGKKALIVYDTMWGSTKKIALALQDGLEDAGIPVTIRFLQTSHISEIMPDVLVSKAILIGTPTLNNGMLPSVSAFLTYLKGLRPKNRIGFAFGSYGWGGQGAKEVKAFMQSMGWEVPLDVVNLQYVPGEDELEAVRETGRKLGEVL
ncbi:FprA family A-type flavoprotein [Desulfofundulus thermocisternus]|jgi:flavorubredoxin|uniref:FprA family A-type flavoprotein n=1 Tax=Desulfofundulus thermocisternus TaxID=42471 RepID=UPI001A0D0B07|nr:FprA family A-type flavoprotein [Desulfofundulus thermocisternus]MBE3585230.1 FprA family A-type flavoprotein [Thermoanaerobacter sp.]MCS5695216.1 FprA family A-type flavoprotein [Desulfofundulus thermocisternus]